MDSSVSPKEDIFCACAITFQKQSALNIELLPRYTLYVHVGMLMLR